MALARMVLFPGEYWRSEGDDDDFVYDDMGVKQGDVEVTVGSTQKGTEDGSRVVSTGDVPTEEGTGDAPTEEGTGDAPTEEGTGNMTMEETTGDAATPESSLTAQDSDEDEPESSAESEEEESEEEEPASKKESKEDETKSTQNRTVPIQFLLDESRKELNRAREIAAIILVHNGLDCTRVVATEDEIQNYGDDKPWWDPGDENDTIEIPYFHYRAPPARTKGSKS